MDHLRKSWKSYRSCSNQQDEAREALLNHSNILDHTTQQQDQFSHDSPDQKGDQIAVQIENDASSVERTGNIASKTSGESSNSTPSSSKKFKVSFEQVLKEAVQRSGKDLPGQGRRETSLDDIFEHNSWRSLVKKTRSRLIDPPEEQYQTSDGAGEAFGEGGDHAEEDITEEHKKMKLSTLTILQCLSLVLILVALVCCLSIPILKRQRLWDLPLWKWELVVLALISGRLVSGWIIKFVVIFIETNFLLRKRVLYFVYGLRKAVQNCLWVGLLLLVWHWIFYGEVKEETDSKILPYANKILLCVWVGTLIWFLKTLLVKVLASSFHVNTFFVRIQEALFNQYIIEKLSGPPLFERRYTEEEEEEEEQEAANSSQPLHSKSMPVLKETFLPGSGNERGQLPKSHTFGKKPRFSKTMARKKDGENLIGHLQKMNPKNIAAWNIKRMISMVRRGTLSTLEENILNSNIEDDSSLYIRSEHQAKEAAKKIFSKVAKTGCQQIFIDDVMCFLGKEEALRAMRLFGAARENEGITKSALNHWLVNAFRERRALALSLNDTKTAVNELHNILNIIVSIVIVIIWLMLLGIPITNFLVFISSQLLLLAFIFGNSCKTAFEALIFLFIMHPFDVGDRCEVDGVQMIVEEMNILTTVFLRFDNQKITYPNSLLATKPIGNYYRSPDMSESIDFCVHISTPMERIALMKERIKGYIEGNRDHWHQSPLVMVKEVEDMNKITMAVAVMHRMNHQQMKERLVRRATLVEEMIKIFRELDIEYRMLPLDVNVTNMPPLVSTRLPSEWTTSAN